ncbi:MAG: hypothetical protein IPK08_13865 [Bacteroidetes bacterium]|nr:hypothetical protein [Bacteroidota bacterium]
MKGSSISNDTGFYGIQGVANVNNNPPPRKFGFVSWVSQNGDLWLFGGGKTSSTTECYNDLWKYSVITNEWTWVKGPNVTNQAGIFGNKGIANPLNNPSPRMETAASWTDDIGNLWLFGGIWYGVSRLNDLWKYNIATNQWTWMKGDSTINANGQYGMLGIENSANNPPSRWIYSHWKDNDGNFWIFGGNGGGWLSDLWKYNVSSNNWTWINGDSTINTINNYG